jgi:hypothetical protein
MKTQSLQCSLLVLLLFISISTEAKIWRINNAGAPADFTTAQAAVTAGAVVSGDTLHFEPSGTSYGNIFVTKRLVIIGNGYFLGSPVNNGNPGLQANTAESKLDQVTVYATGSNSVIMGISCDNVYIGWDALTTNVIFKRNRCNTLQLYTGGTSNAVVSQNYVASIMAGASGSHTNAIITNNIIGAYVQFNADDNGLFANNVFAALAGNWIQLYNFTVRNNIRVQPAAGSSFTSCTLQNNMDCTGNSIFGNADGNVGNVDMSTVFVGYPTIGTNSTDGRYTLKNGSPASGTGYGGSDMGAILNPGNASNNLADTYVPGGLPNVPSVFRLDAPSTVNTSTLNVIISTRTNN